MTASPGGSEERIREVWRNLAIEHFEYRTERSGDVSPYLHGIGVETVTVPLPPELQEIRILLRTVVQRQIDNLRKLNLLPSGIEATRRTLLELGARLHRQIQVDRKAGVPGAALHWSAVTAQAAAMKAMHALELGESQGVEALREDPDPASAGGREADVARDPGLPHGPRPPRSASAGSSRTRSSTRRSPARSALWRRSSEADRRLA